MTTLKTKTIRTGDEALRDEGHTADETRPLLGLHCTSDFSISDDHGQVYSIDEARALWEAGRVAGFNRSFTRLVDSGWDVEKLRASCAEVAGKRS